jgi:hypothetical protein
MRKSSLSPFLPFSTFSTFPFLPITSLKELPRLYLFIEENTKSERHNGKYIEKIEPMGKFGKSLCGIIFQGWIEILCREG